MPRSPHPTLTHVLRQIRTKDDADLMQQGIALLQESFYRTDITPIMDILMKKFPKRISDAIHETIRPSLAEGDIQSVKEFFTALHEAIDKLSLIRLHLAFEPTVEGIEEIAHWVATEIGQGILVDVQVDKTILGGIQIVYQGHIWEKTLHQMITEALERNKNAIAKDLVS